MSSVFQLLRKQSLPVSQSKTLETGGPTIRRRLSSLSLDLKIQPSSSPAAAWALRRTKSISAMGEYAGTSVRKWWDWGWGWILTRKPTFAADLEMNEEEASALGSQSKGSWRHVIYRISSQLRRKLLGSDNVGLPQTFRYDSFKGRSAASPIY